VAEEKKITVLDYNPEDISQMRIIDCWILLPGRKAS
jgi:hypothetical protein